MIWMILALVTLQVSPTTFMAGANVRVVCKVTPHADNRTVEAGVGEYMRSARQLDGAASRKTFEFWFPHVPCGTEMAFCVVHQTRGRSVVQQRQLTVAGCEP